MSDKRIVLTAITNISTDQRVRRTASTFHEAGYPVVVICRKQTSPSEQLPYRVKLFRELIGRGPLFYLEFNLKTFVSLLFMRSSLIYANDLDTLPACYLASAIKRVPLIYDSHELYTEVPELIGRNFKRNLWFRVEKRCIRRASRIITVSNSIAKELTKRYGVSVSVIRNLPRKRAIKSEPAITPTLIYQGALNLGRGIELAIETMRYLPEYVLLIAGTGDIEKKLHRLTEKLGLQKQVKFLGLLNPETLSRITASAWMGISFEEDMGLSYRYALPNKLFDYIAAGIPVATSNLPEMSAIVKQYDIGIIIDNRNPRAVARKIETLLQTPEQMDRYRKRVQFAANELTWEKEKAKLLKHLETCISK